MTEAGGLFSNMSCKQEPPPNPAPPGGPVGPELQEHLQRRHPAGPEARLAVLTPSCRTASVPTTKQSLRSCPGLTLFSRQREAKRTGGGQEAVFLGPGLESG